MLNCGGGALFWAKTVKRIAKNLGAKREKGKKTDFFGGVPGTPQSVLTP